MLFSVLISALILNYQTTKTPSKQANAAIDGAYALENDLDAAVFDTDTCTFTDDEDYTNYSKFTISTFEGLKNFSKAVSNGYTFSGKSVILINDIDGANENGYEVGGKHYGAFNSIGANDYYYYYLSRSYKEKPVFEKCENYRRQRFCFAGTFDGGNHTIANFAIMSNNQYYSDNTGRYPIYPDAFHINEGLSEATTTIKGFFAVVQVGAVIENLHLDNYIIANAKDKNNTTMMGGICGLIWNFTNRESENNETVQITNCKVTNLTMLTDRQKQGEPANINNNSVLMAGICAYGSAEIKDCYVENLESSCNGATAAVGPVRTSLKGVVLFRWNVRISNSYPEWYNFHFEYVSYTDSSYYVDMALVSVEKFKATNCIVKGYDYNFINNSKYSYPDSSVLKILTLERNTDDVKDSYYQTGCDYPLSSISDDRVTNSYYVVVNSKISDYDKAGVNDGIYNHVSEKQESGFSWTETGFDVTFWGGTDDNSVWYYAGQTYNNNTPVLREYVEWQRIFIDINTIKESPYNGGYVTFIDIEEEAFEIYLPVGVKLPEESNDADNGINFYMQRVKPVENDDYEFDSWSINGNTYTAQFKRIAFKLYIIATGDYLVSGYENSAYEVEAGERVTLTYKKETNELIISFTDPSDTTWELVRKIKPKYKMKQDQEVIVMTSNKRIELDNKFELKTYNVILN